MTDKEFQKWKKLTQNRYSEEYDRLNEQQSERLFEFVPKTEEELLDKYGIYVKKYSDGGEVSEFQRKTRRDIMQESLVDGRPDYNKMFQNQNEYQKTLQTIGILRELRIQNIQIRQEEINQAVYYLIKILRIDLQ